LDVSQTPMNKAAAIVFLAWDAASNVNGVVLASRQRLVGGVTALRPQVQGLYSPCGACAGRQGCGRTGHSWLAKRLETSSPSVVSFEGSDWWPG
jgi:hypothetical protein